MQKYVFRGSVCHNGKVLMNNCELFTWAESEKKAISNMKFSFRTKYNICPTTPLSLVGNVESV